MTVQLNHPDAKTDGNELSRLIQRRAPHPAQVLQKSPNKRKIDLISAKEPY
jgi:hypothetical protein